MGTISKISKMIKSKQASCTEITKDYLNKIESSNKELNAYVCVTPDEALSAAARVDEKVKNGEELTSLEGIPMTLKDNIMTTLGKKCSY